MGSSLHERGAKPQQKKSVLAHDQSSSSWTRVKTFRQGLSGKSGPARARTPVQPTTLTWRRPGSRLSAMTPLCTGNVSSNGSFRRSAPEVCPRQTQVSAFGRTGHVHQQQPAVLGLADGLSIYALSGTDLAT